MVSLKALPNIVRSSDMSGMLAEGKAVRDQRIECYRRWLAEPEANYREFSQDDLQQASTISPQVQYPDGSAARSALFARERER